jgi:tetratricopeptide (TPR) repeat protein
VILADTPPVPGDLNDAVVSPTVFAEQWYTYLLRENNVDELQRLERRLQDVCAKLLSRPADLWFPRAKAEFTNGKYADAVKSLKLCIENKLGDESWTTGSLARSLWALGRRQEAIPAYRRATQLSEPDSNLLSEFLSLIVQEEGVDGLRRELPAFEQRWNKLNVRVNAVLSLFSAWAALVAGDEVGAYEKFVIAGPYSLLASNQPTLDQYEALVSVTLINVISERLAESGRLTAGTEFLKRFPPARVQTSEYMKRVPADRAKAMREIFTIPKRNQTGGAEK